MFLTLMLLSVGFLSIAFLGMGIQIMVKGKFPVTSVGHNKEMRKRGISCYKCDEMKRCRKIKRENKKKAEN